MKDDFLASMVTVATAIVGVAILSVLVSKNSQTGSVISAAGGAFAQDLAAAVSPITGGSMGYTGGFTGGAVPTFA